MATEGSFNTKKHFLVAMAPSRFTLFLALLSVHVMESLTFDLLDPKTNLDSFVRVEGSADPSQQTVNYLNGTVYYRLPGQNPRPIFFMEGYNIGRQTKQSNGYLSLSREIVVYRDLRTRQILQVYANPISAKPNEVFYVANDPVNQNLTYGFVVPYVPVPQDRVTFNLDLLLQYPNELDPKIYPNYSAGPIYEADEMFQYYTNYTRLANTQEPSIPMTISWARRAQYLPWMEMGAAPGHLYYIAASWKCMQGLEDVPTDILQLVREKYPKFLQAPSTYEVPNETSWSVFKKVVDDRRAKGQPDIIIPLVNVTSETFEQKNSLDERITSALLSSKTFTVYFNGSVYSEITYADTNYLFNLVGQVDCDVTKTDAGFTLTMKVTGNYFDFFTHEPLRKFNNPMTGDVDTVEPLHTTYSVSVDLSAGWPYSIVVPHMEELAVLAEDSYTRKGEFGEDWAVHMLSLFFPEDSLSSPKPFFYGSLTRFSSWLPWMNMDATRGLLVYRFTLYRNDLV